jgi:hypothetical protein
VGAIALVGVAGALFAGLHDAPGSDDGAFALIYATMLVVALAGVAVAPRVVATAGRLASPGR